MTFNNFFSMNILTFDIEDWYNCDFDSNDFDWDKFEVRIYSGVDKILEALSEKNIKATFFCLGWLAKNHPNVIKKIHDNGHHIGSHSYQHQLITRFDKKEFKLDTERAQKHIEDIIGEKVNAYRAPGFSITRSNLWAFDILSELDYEFDCSIFPSKHDYGGFENFRESEPVILKLNNGKTIKEFPMSIKKIFGNNIVFSGGGFFRFYPYMVIKNLSIKSTYLMTYFHPRDFDFEQPVIKSLPFFRKYKSYVGLKKSFNKFNQYLDDFEFIDILTANDKINWENAKEIKV